MTIHLANVLEVMADAVGDRPALITNDGEWTFAQLDERATRLANHLAAHGVDAGAHVAVHAMSCHQWVEAFYACFKIRAVPINVNYRYVEAELRYLYDNADVVAVIVAPEYVGAVDSIGDALPQLHRLVLGDEYEAALAAASAERGFGSRAADDHYILYTGGTTGMPKGVIWRNEDIILGAMNAVRGNMPIERIEQLGEEAAAKEQLRAMALGPMMHGAAQWLMGNQHVSGGVLVLYTARRFDPATVLELAERSRANSMTMIGDATGRPIAEAQLADPQRFDLTALVAITNGGAPLSAAVREQLREAFPGRVIVDSYGASETGAAGARLDGGEGYSAPRFAVRDDTTVLTDDLRRAAVGEIGKLARTGNIPLGYYKDPQKTAATFPVIDGARWVIPGDFARIEEDGTISILGRGSVSINSGGEKIYPEEVEAALMRHPAVFDAVVVGTPHERWGQQVTALVQFRDGMSATDEELAAHARTLVADYKVPKTIIPVAQVPRTPVGKVDYKGAAALALARLDS